MATGNGRIRGGHRMSKADEALHEGLETMAFELRDFDDLFSDLEAIEAEAAKDLEAAQQHFNQAGKQLASARERFEAVHRHTNAARRRFRTAKRGFQELTDQAGFGVQLRPETLAAARGSVAAIAAAQA